MTLQKAVQLQAGGSEATLGTEPQGPQADQRASLMWHAQHSKDEGLEN